MSSKQNDIISEDIQEAKEEPLGELVGMVGSMLGRQVRYDEVLRLNIWLMETRTDIIRQCQKTALKILNKST